MVRIVNAKTYLVISLLLLCLITTANARTITVDNDGPADFNNIQAAIDDANDNDFVGVVNGSGTQGNPKKVTRERTK